MWKKLSVRWQLLAVLAVVITIISTISLSFAYWFDIKDRKALAIEQTDTLGRALQHDLVLALVNPQADTYADISFRLGGFDSLAALVVLDTKGTEVYRHVRANTIPPSDMIERSAVKPVFSERYLYLRQPLVVDNFRYGDVVHLIDLTRYRSRLREHLITLLSLFPFELFMGLFLAWWVSASYSRPFKDLASAMEATDVKENRFPTVQTTAKNEIGVVFDGFNKMIGQISESTAELKYQSDHDSLTGLYNRFFIERAIASCLQGHDRNVTNALASFDIDKFKLVNDAAGHVAGDELLRQIARIIANETKDFAIVARVGGDDFFVLMENTTEDEALVHCKRIMRCLASFRFPWNKDVYAISASVGVASFRPFEYTLEALFTAVDVAFYTAKSAGHNQIHVYRSDDDHTQQYAVDLQASAAIREALSSGPSRFELFAQAIVPLREESDKVSYEILLRLRNGKGELIAPYAFLPTADRYQLMTDIDIHVLTQYLTTAINQPKHLEHLAFVNINLAGATLNNVRFQETIRSAVRDIAFPWEKLVLEVTETSAVGNLVKATDFIRYCRGLGMRVALDDFGTGMASFEYLKNLPLDIVKIDGCFIRDMLTNPIDHAMVSYADKISKLRNQATIAEFVETAEHLVALKEIGIDFAQGYHLGRPRPLEEWLAESRAR